MSLAELPRREATMKTAQAEAREARNRLELLGVSRQEVERLDREDTIKADVPLRAPFDGRVIMRNITRGEALLPVVGSERVLLGHLFTSFHFSASTVNDLLSSSADDSSKCPEYKVSAVRVEPIERDELDPEDEVELRHMRRRV